MDEMHSDEYDEGHAFDPDEDINNGICRECETWGEIQCRVHGDAYLNAQRAEREHWWLTTLARRGKRTKASRRARSRLYHQRIAVEALYAYDMLRGPWAATADAEDIPW